MAGLNKVMLIGNLGRDPEIRYSQQGLAVVNFSLATSEQWTDKTSGDRQEKTEWHNVVVFGKQAETCEKYLSKGSQIYIEGKLQTSTYEKDGQTHYMTKVVASNFMFLGGKQDAKGGVGTGGGYQKSDSGGSNHYQGQTQPGMGGGPGPMPDDDIPF
ncbi:MAG: single-stranded DNA-binding protein [Deltaproteobacteria bacterium RIFOXYC2_FULL_48_10]|nr:MAG: single-stranded DNA-binding protein [Deltaproteobacteria bacterium RIFOXYC2_FULL_48_10]OGR52509.1 MAG: single-stranded DNA-binding protein [Desulfobacula sp. RIFOXYB2_FULL_45_6]